MMTCWLLGAGGRKKKDSTAEESDDEEGLGHHALGAKRPPQCKLLVLT